MAVTNTGIVERVITGVNESDLWLDTEATSVVSNTGVVERSVTGVHDANFVRPLGDELISNGDFSNGSTGWIKALGVTISGGLANADATASGNIIRQSLVTLDINKTYRWEFTISNYVNGSIKFASFDSSVNRSANGTYVAYSKPNGTGVSNIVLFGTFEGSIDNISVKEMLVNRESTATNTGIVERPITGVNESDLWLDSESTSVVNNTGIVERPVLGVNESDEMFPDNTISNIVNIAGLISSLIADLKARATTFENEDATQEILINLQKC